ncbi:hypothetical protein FRB90_010761 [Tulasnella sp. 427]|nr:hypothetical protein FRB90_010761 [Tulasnella sp. 427]
MRPEVCPFRYIGIGRSPDQRVCIEEEEMTRKRLCDPSNRSKSNGGVGIADHLQPAIERIYTYVASNTPPSRAGTNLGRIGLLQVSDASYIIKVLRVQCKALEKEKGQLTEHNLSPLLRELIEESNKGVPLCTAARKQAGTRERPVGEGVKQGCGLLKNYKPALFAFLDDTTGGVPNPMPQPAGSTSKKKGAASKRKQVPSPSKDERPREPVAKRMRASHAVSLVDQGPDAPADASSLDLGDQSRLEATIQDALAHCSTSWHTTMLYNAVAFAGPNALVKIRSALYDGMRNAASFGRSPAGLTDGSDQWIYDYVTHVDAMIGEL